MLMTIFGILILAMALFLVVTILLQSSRDHRLSGTIAGGAETFFGKQKGKTMDSILNKVTAVVCVVFFICVLLMYVFQDTAVSGGTDTNGTITDLNDLIESGDIVIDDTADGENGEDADVTDDAENDEDVDTDAEVEPEANTDAEADTADNGDNADDAEADAE